MKDAVLSHLSENYPWKDHFHWFDTIGSTSDHLRALARSGAPQGTVVAADCQTDGHGRRGRSFQSAGGKGVYLSILLRPDCPPTALMHLTCAAAVSMCDAVEAVTGLRPGIKWTNDLVWEKQKLGGILTELGFTPRGEVDYAIIGVGINCTHCREDFDPPIRDTAASLAMVTGNPVDRFALAGAMMTAFSHMDLTRRDAILHRYRSGCITLGKEISLVRGEEIRHGKALDIDEDGALLVLFPNGNVEAVNSGEVSVRGMYGYV